MRRVSSIREPDRPGTSRPPRPVLGTSFGTHRQLRTIRTGSGTWSEPDEFRPAGPREANRMRRRRIVFSVLGFLLIAVVVFVAVGAWRFAGMPPAVKTGLGPARAQPELVF